MVTTKRLPSCQHLQALLRLKHQHRKYLIANRCITTVASTYIIQLKLKEIREWLICKILERTILVMTKADI